MRFSNKVPYSRKTPPFKSQSWSLRSTYSKGWFPLGASISWDGSGSLVTNWLQEDPLINNCDNVSDMLGQALAFICRTCDIPDWFEDPRMLRMGIKFRLNQVAFTVNLRSAALEYKIHGISLHKAKDALIDMLMHARNEALKFA